MKTTAAPLPSTARRHTQFHSLLRWTRYRITTGKLPWLVPLIGLACLAMLVFY